MEVVKDQFLVPLQEAFDLLIFRCRVEKAPIEVVRIPRPTFLHVPGVKAAELFQALRPSIGKRTQPGGFSLIRPCSQETLGRFDIGKEMNLSAIRALDRLESFAKRIAIEPEPAESPFPGQG